MASQAVRGVVRKLRIKTAAFELRRISCRARCARKHGAVSVMSLQKKYESSTPGLGRGFWLGRGGAPGARLWRSPGSTEFVGDRTETRRKLRVQGVQVARFPANQFFPFRPWRPLGNPRSWPVLANANRGDWFVKISKRFCRSFHLSRNDGIASKIIARDPF